MAEPQVFDLGHIRMTTSQLHTVKPLDVDIPRGRLVAVTGVSGSGKTTMELESLIPALKAQAAGERLPEHVRELEAEGHQSRESHRRHADWRKRTLHRGHLCPIFTTNCCRAFARCDAAKTGGWKAGDFSVQHMDGCVAPRATAPVRSHSTCSSCRT